MCRSAARGTRCCLEPGQRTGNRIERKKEAAVCDQHAYVGGKKADRGSARISCAKYASSPTEKTSLDQSRKSQYLEPRREKNRWGISINQTWARAKEKPGGGDVKEDWWSGGGRWKRIFQNRSPYTTVSDKEADGKALEVET